jgi:hypothetical protein
MTRKTKGVDDFDDKQAAALLCSMQTMAPGSSTSGNGEKAAATAAAPSKEDAPAKPQAKVCVLLRQLVAVSHFSDKLSDVACPCRQRQLPQPLRPQHPQQPQSPCTSVSGLEMKVPFFRSVYFCAFC